MSPASHAPRVGLFATCLMNLFRPNVGFAAVKLLEDAGCIVEVPQAQPAVASRAITQVISTSRGRWPGR